MHTEHHLDNTAAAAFLGVSPRTLERKRLEGDGPKFVKIGRRVVYRLRDLEAYLDQNTYSSTAAAKLARSG